MTNEIAITITLTIVGITIVALFLIAHLWIWDDKEDDLD